MFGTLIASAALFISILAAIYAWRSAQAAEQSAEIARRTLERAAHRDIIRCAADVVMENSRIKDLISEAKNEYKELFSLSGSSASSRLPLCLNQLSEKEQDAGVLAQKSQAIMAEGRNVEHVSERDATSMLSQFDTALVQLRPIRESVERELAETKSQTKIYREQIISSLIEKYS